MKKAFKEYIPLSQKEIDGLWANGIFIFDTNILLNFYRYSDESSAKFIETIEKLGKRVWLPYHVGLEFNKKRLAVISEQKKCYLEFEKKIGNLTEEVENNHRNPFLSEVLTEKLTSMKEDIKKEIEDKVSYYDNLLSNDVLFLKINLIFDDKVGESFSSDEIKKVASEGDKRYKEKIPPGYKDISKPDNDKYGDLIIWKQILHKSKTDKCNVIFVLDDRKEDWWLEHQGKTISARPELLKEFNFETSCNCHFYKPFQFLEFSNKYLNSKISSKIIEEVKNYKVENDLNKINQDIIVEIILKGKEQNITNFIADLKVSGYRIFLESNSNDLFSLRIILPNIPDLERRFNDRYLQNLSKYDIMLITKNIK